MIRNLLSSASSALAVVEEVIVVEVAETGVVSDVASMKRRIAEVVPVEHEAHHIEIGTLPVL